MSPVLRVSTHIYGVSEEIDGKTFIFRVNLGMWPSNQSSWKNKHCSEGFNTHLWGFSGDRWENVHWSFVSIYRNKRTLWSKSKTWNELKFSDLLPGGKSDWLPPFETARALSQLFAVQCRQWEPIWNGQLIGIYKEIPVQIYKHTDTKDRYKEKAIPPGQMCQARESTFNFQIYLGKAYD